MDIPTEYEEPNPEVKDFKKRFWLDAALTVPLIVLTMWHFVGLGFIREMIGERVTLWVELILGTPVVLWSGFPFMVRGWNSVVNRSLNMFTLIGMGVSAAYIFSVVAVISPGIFPDGFRDAQGHVGVYFEAAAVIVVLVLLLQVFLVIGPMVGLTIPWPWAGSYISASEEVTPARHPRLGLLVVFV